MILTRLTRSAPSETMQSEFSMAQLILYACPIGPLAQQIETYFAKSQQRCGANAAHAYMPHCTLTGFFEDSEDAIAHYVDTLETVLAESSHAIPTPSILIKQLTFHPHWHGLELEATWLKQLVATFAEKAVSPTQTASLRLKDWLHLSLAYEFDRDYEFVLQTLARAHIDLTAAVAWELRFYQRHPGNRWQCHRHWSFSA